MARRTQDGRFTIAAGEVGAYTVCPESWRLRMIERTPTTKAESVSLGQKLHDKWASDYDESVFLFRGARIVVGLLILISILVFSR